jgi:hypothetical protein
VFFAVLFSSLHLALSVVFQCFALFTEVRSWFYGGLLVDVYGILSAVLAPMPPVNFASSNILHHSNHFVSIFNYQLMLLRQLKTFFHFVQKVRIVLLDILMGDV